VFVLATLAGSFIRLNIDFLPYSFVTYTTMLVLSIALICGLKKHVKYNIAWPKFKKTLKPILFGFLAAVIVNTPYGSSDERFGEARSSPILPLM